MPRARPISVALTLLASAILAYWFITAPAGSPTLRQFDPNRMAELELRMWQAYYGKDRIRLFALLVTQLHEQNHYSWANATRAGFYLARAAATFGDARANSKRSCPIWSMRIGSPESRCARASIPGRWPGPSWPGGLRDGRPARTARSTSGP